MTDTSGRVVPSQSGYQQDRSSGSAESSLGTATPDSAAPMTLEQIAAKGTFVRVLREYADRANDNFSQKVAVPEHVLRDAAAAIEDQRAHIDTLTAACEALDEPFQWLVDNYPRAMREMPTHVLRRFDAARALLERP